VRSSGARGARAAQTSVLVTAMLSGVTILMGCSGGSDDGLIPSGSLSAVAVSPSGVDRSGSAGATAGGTPALQAQRSGGADPSGSPPAIGTPSAAPALAAPTLPAVRGYTYTRAPAEVVAAFVVIKPAPAGVLGPPAVRSVRKGDDVIGSVAVRALARGHVGDIALETSLVNGMVAGLGGKGYTVRNRTVSGDRVVVATRKDSTILAWYSKGLVLQLVSSAPQEDALAYATAYLAAH